MGGRSESRARDDGGAAADSKGLARKGERSSELKHAEANARGGNGRGGGERERARLVGGGVDNVGSLDKPAHHALRSGRGCLCAAPTADSECDSKLSSHRRLAEASCKKQMMWNGWEMQRCELWARAMTCMSTESPWTFLALRFAPALLSCSKIEM